MSAHGLLDQLLRSGRDLLAGGGAPGRSGSGGLGGLGGLGNLGNLSNLGNLGNLGGLGQIGAGAGVAGVLGALLGSKRGRSYGGKALKYGSIAALGLMAYKAYTAWQAQQQAQGQGQAQGQSHAPGSPSSSQASLTAEPRTLDRVPQDEAEEHSRAVLLAMIAAAKADGHLDDRERELIEQALSRVEDDPELRRWQEDVLRRPLDPAAVAQAATTPEIASEMYLASLLMVDETSYMERAYLDELARQLKLPEGLKSQLEAQALAQG
ncbi:tellurite resistance TerB family protein [Roseateles noduli]|uniref:tellurite resistance TerB family protein n=1 Tax=Roseateles noduli TaxID=2052484 RepID=UPI003D655BDC